MVMITITITMLMLRMKVKQRFLYNFDKFFRAVFCVRGRGLVLIFVEKKQTSCVTRAKKKMKNENEKEKTEPTCVGKTNVYQ